MTAAVDRSRVLAMVLAGGRGARLRPLTDDRAKPAVPFGGQYRLIDFALSNLANGGFRKIVVLTQYKSHSLDVHISRTWRMSTLLGNYVTSIPAQMRRGDHWFMGSADAIAQNMNLLDDEQPDHVLVFGADHIYRMDPRQMLDHHIASGAGATVAAIRVPRSEASQLGVVDKDPGSTGIRSFLEKPADPPALPDASRQSLASMGNYVFSADVLREALETHRREAATEFDIGGDLIPALVAERQAHVYDFTSNEVPGETERDRHYWRDVGTLDAYYEAQMDLVAPLPVFNLYNDAWPVYTSFRTLPPAKVLGGEVGNTLLSNGAIVSGAVVRDSVLSPGVRVEPGAVVEGAILLDDVVVESGAVVRRAIVDKNVVVPPGREISAEAVREGDAFTVSDNGIVAVPKNELVKP
jgi:glucose-1-phosphate adenylyltransferase